MKTRLAELQTRFEALAPRERVLLAAAALVVVITLVYLLAWEPLVRAHAQRTQALDSARALANRIETAAALAQRRVGTRVDRNTSLVTAVDQTSRSPTLGKAPSRLQPEGEREVKVWVEDVIFENLLRWINELETRYGIVPSSAEIERGDAAGTVSARLTLVRN